MLVIRFLRAGKKNQPFFKLVVVEKDKSATSGRFVEEVGFYNPLTKEKNLRRERVEYWLSIGVKPSETVHNLLVSEKIIKGKKIPLHKKSKKKEEKPAPEKPTEEKPAEEKPAEKPASAEVATGEEKKPAEEISKEEKKEAIPSS